MHPVMAMVVLSDPIALSSLKYGVVGLVWLQIELVVTSGQPTVFYLVL